MPPKPYIGISSVTDYGDAIALRDALPMDIKSHTIAIGMGVSQKTLAGIPTKYPNRYLDPKLLASVFPHKGTINIVHYNCDDISDMSKDLTQISNYTKDLVHAFQINAPLQGAAPQVCNQLYAFEEAMLSKGQRYRVILQIRPEAQMSPEAIYAWVKVHIPVITDILLDMSLGRGIEIDHHTLSLYKETIPLLESYYPDLGIGVAGGLGPGTIAPWKELFHIFPRLSGDSETKTRTLDDKLDINKAKQFIAEIANEIRAK